MPTPKCQNDRTMGQRSLSDAEISALESQGCISSGWSDITVSESFSTDNIHRVRFEGKVYIGRLGGEVINSDGEVRTSGLFNSRIINCQIGNSTLIDNVKLIRNYHLEENVQIENVDMITVDGPSSFGNGFQIEVLNEGGGRELLIFDQLTAQLAYLLVTYRHDREFIGTVNGMIEAYAKNISSGTGKIGTGSEITNSGKIKDVKMGAFTSIRGASSLKNGTLLGNRHAPVIIGDNVIAKNFIVLSGSRIDGGALVEKCFVGQGVEIGKQFSAENSVFFANSEAFHGEAVSIFAGPYTVTHHKSTLLIAGMFSFFNAGSGTNQSNHMYKLGPVHQGIIERGSKTGSFSYLLWPSRIGAYSVVMGKNMASFDTGDFPFSYINVDRERSILTPGMNLFSVGTRRDSEKWPNRDKRKDPEKADLINFDFLSPYVIQKVVKSLDLLKELYEKTAGKQETVFYKGIRIKRLMLKATRKYYEMALSIYIGNQVVSRLERMEETDTIETIRKGLLPSGYQKVERWLDLAGMIAPDRAIHDLIHDSKSGEVHSLDVLIRELNHIHENYESYSWDWTVGLLSELFNIEVSEIVGTQLIELISLWEEESLKLDKMILNDATKEYDDSSKIGFGIDGDEEIADKDFTAVRGTPEDNKFIKGIREDMEQIKARSAGLINSLKEMC